MKYLFFILILSSCSFEESNDYPLYPSCNCDRITKVKGYINQDTGQRINYIITSKNDCTSVVRVDTIPTTIDIDFKINKCLNQY